MPYPKTFKCDHELPPSLNPFLRHPICPSCILRLHINEIRETKEGIKNRGGIFSSKQKVLEEKAKNEKLGSAPVRTPQQMRHTAWMRKWKNAKICAWRDIALFEKMEAILEASSGEAGDDGGLDMIEQALALWEGVREEVTSVPGVKLVGDEDTDGEESSDEDSSNDREHEREKGVPWQEQAERELHPKDIPLPADDGNWEEPPGGNHKLGENPLTTTDELSGKPADADFLTPEGIERNDVLQLEYPKDVPLPNEDDEDLDEEKPQSTISPSPPDREVIEEMEGFTTRLLKRMDADDEHKLRAATQRPSLLPSSPSRRSILRRSNKTPSPRPSTPRIGSSVRIRDLVTVLADPLSPTPIEQPHNPHTAKETSHRQRSYNRKHVEYRPHVWASPDGHEKLDTSFFYTSWDRLDDIECNEIAEEDEGLGGWGEEESASDTEKRVADSEENDEKRHEWGPALALASEAGAWWR